jgi:hypothetical protein
MYCLTTLPVAKTKWRRMIERPVHDELERLWQEIVVTSVEVPYREFPVGIESNHEEPQSRESVSWPRFEPRTFPAYKSEAL